MLYEFSLTVGTLDSFSAAIEPITNQALVQILYGIKQNGIIASLYNGVWWDEIRKKKNAIPDRIRPIVLNLLSQLYDHGRIIQRPKEGFYCPKNDAEWFGEALASHDRVPFQCIITRKNSINARSGLPTCAVSLEEVLLAPQWNDRRISRRISRTSVEFENALFPVLSTARLITIIDPHIAIRVFRGNREFLKTLSIIDKCAIPDRRRCNLSVIEIHTKDHSEIPDDRYDEVIKSIKRAMPKCVGNAKDKRFFAWREKRPGKLFHNRRILTNQTAISCPWGLDIHEDYGDVPGDDEWSILDDNVRQSIWSDFQKNTSPYELRQEIRW